VDGDTLQTQVDALVSGPGPVRWGVAVRNADSGEVLAASGGDDPLSTASVGKILLLTEVARQLEDGSLTGTELLDRSVGAAVADSGLWQHLAVPVLPLADVCALVGAVSDNLATNVLLERVGVQAVAAVTAALGLKQTALHDRVRDQRGPADAVRLSTGTAHELSDFFARLHRSEVLGPLVSARVRGWLGIGADLSMAAAAFHLDPLSHEQPDRGIALAHKTGTDSGVRVDTGLVEGPAGSCAYAFLANWPPSEDHRDTVLETMAALGRLLRGLVPIAG
jgi:beta-lactamase class A